MPRALIAFAASLAVCLAAADPPRPPAKNPGPVARAVGAWVVTFANGVVEVCDVRPDGDAAVSEPNRTAAGRAELRGGEVVIAFEDDRVERWTVVGDRRVVEHFYPASEFPAGRRVLGIAERLK